MILLTLTPILAVWVLRWVKKLDTFWAVTMTVIWCVMCGVLSVALWSEKVSLIETYESVKTSTEEAAGSNVEDLYGQIADVNGRIKVWSKWNDTFIGFIISDEPANLELIQIKEK